MSDPEIFQRLKADHDKHRAMLADLEGTQAGSAERETLSEALRVEISAHAAAEEESLYATMLGKPDLRDDAKHSVSEHKEIDDLFADLFKADSASSEWDKAFGELKHRYLHHIDEEEEEMFPAAADGLSGQTQDRLAEVFIDRKPKEKERAANEEPGDERD